MTPLEELAAALDDEGQDDLAEELRATADVIRAQARNMVASARQGDTIAHRECYGVLADALGEAPA